VILLVDDDVQLLEAAGRELDGQDSVLFAGDGAHAQSLLQAVEFSVALVDLNLPDCNGFSLIEDMHAAHPELPIVAISGVWSGSVLESAKEFGASEVLSKPPTPEWSATVERLRTDRMP